MRTLRECPEINTGSCTTSTMLFLHNLDDQDTAVDLSSLADTAASPAAMLADRDYGDIDLAKLAVSGYGYRWIRLR